MSIQILPEDVASQIAAGEVVERPSSVVKELMENSLDAGAEKIEIYIEKAGRSLIEVSDNGVGIASEELNLSVARHATSKLSTVDDLNHISTLGFRGEALASIASVSHLIITSRTENATQGARLRIEGGILNDMETIGCPVGTVVSVRDLFYNVPARLKFLKTDNTERQQIDGLVSRYAIAYPKVKFKVVHDGRLAFQTAGNNDRREALTSLYGIEISRQLLEVIFDEGDIHISGLISPISLTRSNRREMTFFVNGRWVQDISLSSALLTAYRNLLMVGRFPMVFIFLQIAPEEVDVNVHPAKTEVRFQHPERIFSSIQRAVRRALLAYSPIPEISQITWQHELPGKPDANHPHVIDPAWNMAAELKEISLVQKDPTRETEDNKIPEEERYSRNNLPLLRLVGQVGASYLVAEAPDGLYLIDQHAAHERILFERFGKYKNEIPSQSLLEPLVFQMPPQDSQLLSGQVNFLSEIGFDIELFGHNTYRVKAIPSFLAGSDPILAVRSVVEDFEEDETPLKNSVESRLIARICKRSAVKAGHVLSVEEQNALLRDLEACQSPRTCPHGRPTMIHLSVDLLERQFGRRGSR